MAGTVDAMAAPILGGIGSLAKYSWLLYILGALVMLGIIAYIAVNFTKSKNRWDIKLRVRQEDNQYGKIYLDPVEMKGRRVTLSNGLRLIYLEKPIFGKKLFPLLNYHTRPGVYDLILTSDNRIFIITGIDGIDEQRKTLKVGIRYPGIDYSMEEVNRDHAKLNTLDRRSDMAAIVKAGAVAVVAIVILVIFIVGITKYAEIRETDIQISQAELQLFESLERYQLSQNEQTNSMIILTEKLKQVVGTNNLRSALSEAS